MFLSKAFEKGSRVISGLGSFQLIQSRNLTMAAMSDERLITELILAD